MPESNSPPVDGVRGESPAEHAPVARTKEPTLRAPIGACDAHLTLPGGLSGPRGGGSETLPPEYGFEDWLTLCRDHLDTLGCTRAVIVSWGAEPTVTAEAVRRLGEQARGVVAVGPEVQDHALSDLVQHRIRGIQVDLTRAGGLGWDAAKALAPRLADHGLHLELALHADRHLPRLAGDIAALPVPVVVDHCGWPENPDVDSVGLQALMRLLGDGRAWVKLSGISRLAEPARQGPDVLIRSLVTANPERCLWGSDWPHLVPPGAQRPDSGVLFDEFCEIVETPETRQRILVDNPEELYRF